MKGAQALKRVEHWVCPHCNGLILVNSKEKRLSKVKRVKAVFKASESDKGKACSAGLVVRAIESGSPNWLTAKEVLFKLRRMGVFTASNKSPCGHLSALFKGGSLARKRRYGEKGIPFEYSLKGNEPARGVESIREKGKRVLRVEAVLSAFKRANEWLTSSELKGLLPKGTTITCVYTWVTRLNRRGLLERRRRGKLFEYRLNDKAREVKTKFRWCEHLEGVLRAESPKWLTVQELLKGLKGEPNASAGLVSAHLFSLFGRGVVLRRTRYNVIYTPFEYSFNTGLPPQAKYRVQPASVKEGL